MVNRIGEWPPPHVERPRMTRDEWLLLKRAPSFDEEAPTVTAGELSGIGYVVAAVLLGVLLGVVLMGGAG